MAQISVEDLPPDANLGVLSFLDARCMAVAQLSCQAFRVLTPAAARAREALHTSLYLKQRQQVAEQAAATEEEAALPDYLTLVRRKSQAAYSLAAPSSEDAPRYLGWTELLRQQETQLSQLLEAMASREEESSTTKKKGGGATPSRKDCANCGASEGTVPGVPIHKPCSRCMITFYCSVKCQKHHWKQGGHKQHCVATEDRSVAKAAAEEKTTQKKTMAKKKNAGATAAAAAAEEEEDICAICQYPLSESPSKPLSCSHVYHVACVEKLRSFDIKQACPVCRVELPAGPEQLFEEGLRRWFVLFCRYGQGEKMPWRRISENADRREHGQAVRMLKEAAEQGLPEAQAHLGFMYMEGMSVPPNYSTSAKWSRKAADQNHAGAQFNLGVMYENGRGVPRSDVKAVKWWRKSADQGNEYAQHNLGNMYGSGLGVPQSDTSAVEWYRRAADQGHAPAQCNLGLMYKYGKGGLPQSLALTLEWYRKAAEQGFAEGQLKLGCMYWEGKGVPHNFPEALRWLRKAQAQGHPMATKFIGEVEQVMQRRKQAAATGQSQPPSLPSSPIPIGSHVELRGLNAKPELNGQRGVVAGVDAVSGRCKVKLNDGRGPFSLKPENLHVVFMFRSI